MDFPFNTSRIFQRRLFKRADISEVADTSKTPGISMILHTRTAPGFLILSPGGEEGPVEVASSDHVSIPQACFSRIHFLTSTTATSSRCLGQAPQVPEWWHGKILQNFANFWRARSRLYQNEILQENMRLTGLFKLYEMCTLFHRSKLKILENKLFEKSATFAKMSANILQILLEFKSNIFFNLDVCICLLFSRDFKAPRNVMLDSRLPSV